MQESGILELGRSTPHFDDHRLYSCGVVLHEPLRSSTAGGPDYRLYFISEGRGSLEADGAVHHLARGEGLLIPPGQALAFHMDTQDPWLLFWVGFCGSKAQDCLHLSGLGNGPAFRFTGGDELLSLVREMLDCDAPGAENELLLQSLLFRFLSCLSRALVSGSDGEKGGRDNTYVQKAIAYIHSSYATGITVSDVAHHVSLNRSYLFTLFQRVLEVSPQDYLTWYRMSRAKERLVQSDDTVASIARSCGYADPQVFSRAFKQQVGMTPVSYRRAERANTQYPSESGPK